jgi:hypothetical protein
LVLNVSELSLSRAGMTKNTHFLEQVSRIFGKDDEIIVVRELRLLNESKFQRLYVHFGWFLNSQWKLISPVVPSQGCQSGKRSLMAATELCSAVS